MTSQEAYEACISYIRNADIVQLQKFADTFKNEINILKADDDPTGYIWIRNAWLYYKDLNK